MKLKNIFLITMITGVLSACVSEELINGPTTSTQAGIPTSFSLKLNVAGPITKALVGEAGNEYTLANPDELYVSNVVVAIFDTENGQPNELIGFKYATGTDLQKADIGAGATKDTLAYEIKGIQAETGDVHIIAIANTKIVPANFEGLNTYAAFQTLIETNTTAGNEVTPTFSPRELVKVGEINYTLTPTAKSVEIPMTQLAARINLKFNVNELPEKVGEPYLKAKYGNNDFTEEQMRTWAHNSYPSNAGITACDEPGPFYVDGKIIKKFSSGTKLLHLADYTVQQIQPYTRWRFNIDELKIYNVETKSQILLGENTEKNLMPITLDANMNGRFYTYEKNVNTQLPLTIEAKGDLIKEKIDSIKQMKGSFHIFWLKKSAAGLPEPDAGTTNEYTLLPGGGGTGYFFVAPFGNIEELKLESTTGTISDEEIKNTTFKAIINPRKSMPDCNTDGVIHGNNYDILGTINLKNMSMGFTTKVVPWSERTFEIGANIKDIHYLFVSEYNIYMPNINTYTFKYASDLNVTYEILSAFCYEYKKEDGTRDTKYYNPGDPEYPKVTINPVNNTITIKMDALPKNYVPTNITLKIKTADGTMFEEVKVTHYPTPYVDGYWNTATNGGVPNINDTYGGRNSKPNHNIFTVTSIAAGNFKIGNSTELVTIDGRTDVIVTKSDLESNQLVSPKFVIASQWGITSPITHANAKIRCSKYYEGIYNKAGTWRMPTMAEIELINSIQYDTNSAVKKLLQGDTYWSAYPYQYYNIDGVSGSRGFQSGSATTTTYVRCVHDVY